MNDTRNPSSAQSDHGGRSREPGEFKPEWAVDRTFEAGQAVVVVLKSNHRTPSYRLMINFKLGEDRRVPSYQPRFEAVNGAVTMADPIDLIVSAWADAKAYILSERQKAEEIYQAYRARDRTNSGPAQRPGIKKLGQMDKAKREAAAKTAAKAAEGAAATIAAPVGAVVVPIRPPTGDAA